MMDDLTRQAVEWIKNRDEAMAHMLAMMEEGWMNISPRNVDETILKEPLKSKVLEIYEIVKGLDYVQR